MNGGEALLPSLQSDHRAHVPIGPPPQGRSVGKIPKVTSRGTIRILSSNCSLERWEVGVSTGETPTCGYQDYENKPFLH